jgi:AcrR family transcriptional regulator
MQLHCTEMSDLVKPDRRAARKEETERRLVEAATRLFVARGYPATTLAAVADEAGVAHRTVYARFPTKADLLHRCIDVAIRGDEADVAIDDRSWVQAAMSAPTAAARIRAMAGATADLMGRCGALLRVAQEAEAIEPSIAARAQAGRLDTQRVVETFWRTMASDGLLPAKVDVDWLAVTGAVTAQAETYLLVTRTLEWDIDAYADWLEATWRRLARA